MPARALKLMIGFAGLTILLASCGSDSHVQTTDRCIGWRVILVADGDVLTRGTSEQILGHNLNGERAGCW